MTAYKGFTADLSVHINSKQKDEKDIPREWKKK